MDAIRGAGLKLAVDPLGGAAVHYWGPVNEIYGLHIEVVNPRVDPTFAFMTLDHDGKIRMDCSSPHAMARLSGLKDVFDVAFGNDPDKLRKAIFTQLQYRPTGSMDLFVQYGPDYIGGGSFPVHRIYCVGRNYAEHAQEMGHSGREPPFFFMKNSISRARSFSTTPSLVIPSTC